MGLVVVYLVILVAAFFFLVVRPQRRQMASHRALVASLDVGDEIITTGGILGTIQTLEDDIVELQVAPGVVLRVARAAIARKVPTDHEAIGDPDAADDGDAG
jgi:preprotein translocase subunit YajC